MKYDLHAHSVYSDGQWEPAVLMAHAKSQGLDVIALTDHDTIDGLAEAKLAAQSLGLHLISGVEISVSWFRKELHILGLNIDPHHPLLNEGLQQQRVVREDRAKAIGEKLKIVGIHDAYEGALAFSGKGLVARPHFASFLVANGYAKDMASAFKRYLKSGKIGYVKTPWVSLELAVQWITQAGGIAVLAHPARYRLTRTELSHLLQSFVNAGGKALEVVTSNHTSSEIAQMAELCRQWDLYGSQGSDFHGPDGRALLGVLPPFPTDIKPIWSGWFL